MTEAELKAIEAHGGEWSNGAEVLRLVAEVRRLRGLIKATFNDRSRSDCQWCDGNGADDCPAFTTGGEV